MVDDEVNYDRRRDILHPGAGCFFLALAGAAVGLDVKGDGASAGSAVGRFGASGR